MKIEDIITLINAGYSKDDIDRMVSGESQPEPKPEPEPKSEPEPEPKSEPEPEPEPEPDPTIAQLIKQNNDLLNQLKKLQSQNAKAARQEQSAPLSGVDAIKNFITAQ